MNPIEVKKPENVEAKPKDLFTEYVQRNSLEVLENANQYPGPTGFFAYVLEKAMEEHLTIMPERPLKAHLNKDIYIHKLPLALYVPYCSGHSLARVLEKGMITPTVISKPAKHFDTFVDHVANFLIIAQQHFTGAQAFSSVEWYAGPFIRNDRLDYKQIKQNIQRMVFNLNYPSRIGMQSPFTNFTVTMDAATSILEGDYAYYDGKKVAPLGEYEKEAKLFLLALTEVLREGDAIGQPFTYPIPTLMASAPMLWNDPEIYEAIFKTAAKRGSFYWLNTNVVDPNASFAMCCRINIDKNELKFAFSVKKKDEDERIKEIEKQRFGGLWAMPDVTGSIQVTTINLPRLALEAKDDDKFWELYAEKLTIIKEIEDWFRERYVKLIRTHKEMYKFFHSYLWDFPSSHFNTIGIIGLPEAAAIYMNNPELWFEGSRKDWLEAAKLMRDMVRFAVKYAREWMKMDGTPWNVEEVPGESAAAKLAIADAKKYPEVLNYLNDPENPIYSTSVAPYYGALELSDRIRIESMVQPEFTGGVMMHIFLGEQPEPDALAALTKKILKTKIVYWSFTPAITVCNHCKKSYTGLYTQCPSCGSTDVEMWSRIIGYYRPLRNWNPYRKKEFWTRAHYSREYMNEMRKDQQFF